MKASELRIGNIIHSLHEDFNTEKIVDAHTIALIEDYERDPDDEKWSRGGIPEMYAYIPLNSEWLERFGFDREIVDVPALDSHEEFSKDEHCFIQDIKGLWFLGGYHSNKKHFAHIHELQNLYFAITGNELELK